MGENTRKVVSIASLFWCWILTMYKISRQKLKHDYNKAIFLSERNLSRGNLELAIKYIQVATKWMYNYNICYADDRIENIISNIAESFDTPKVKGKKEKRIVFCDSFAMDNRGLSLIYVKALIKLGYDILFVTYEKNKNTMRRIKAELEKSKLSEIVLLEEGDKSEQLTQLTNKIIEFEPRDILLHILPWDVNFLVLCHFFDEILERYMINITDHAFWLGKSAIDFCIEYRSYGYNISLKERRIEDKKLLILPYYPARTEEKFQGFSFSLEGKRMIFSGGSLFKTSGSTIFWDIIKYILDNYNDTIFVYAGSGNTEEMQNFIQKNGFEERFYHISERLDLDEIMKRCYFYLSTYPISGGLMAQYAVANGKVPVTFTSGGILCNEVDSVFINTNGEKLSFYSQQELYLEIDKMLTDSKYLSEQEQKWKSYLPHEGEFTAELDSLLKKHMTKYTKEIIDIDTLEFSNIFFASQKNNYLSYANILIQSKSFSINRHYLKEILKGGICFIRKKIVQMSR